MLQSVETDATATAQQLAQAEGLKLIPSINAAGYKGVKRHTHSLGYSSRARENNSDVHLGTFDSAAEAALAYARYLGPARCAEEAQRRRFKNRLLPHQKHEQGQFGVPRVSARVETQGHAGVEEVVTTVESVLANSREHGDEDVGEVETPVSVHALPPPNHGAAVMVEHVECMRTPRSSSTNGASFKRRRIAHTDEYDFTTPHSMRELAVQVPEGAVRATITFHFA